MKRALTVFFAIPVLFTVIHKIQEASPYQLVAPLRLALCCGALLVWLGAFLAIVASVTRGSSSVWRKLTVIGAGAIVGGSLVWLSPAWAQIQEFIALRAVKDAVRTRLVDPDSASFDGVAFSHEGIVCGFVNSRNGFGGYNGFRPFMVDSSGVVFVDDIETMFRVVSVKWWKRSDVINRSVAIG